MIKRLLVLTIGFPLSMMSMYNPAIPGMQRTCPGTSEVRRTPLNQQRTVALDPSCCVCMEDFNDKEHRRVVLNCKWKTKTSVPHMVCQECMGKLKICPICRDTLKIDRTFSLHGQPLQSENLYHQGKEEKPLAESQRRRQETRNRTETSISYKLLPLELIAALIAGLFMSGEFEKNLSSEEKSDVK